VLVNEFPPRYKHGRRDGPLADEPLAALGKRGEDDYGDVRPGHV
jgi:hypothetical protein